MFVRVVWQSGTGLAMRSGRMRLGQGVVNWWVVGESGRGQLCIHYTSRESGNYTSALKYTSLGILGVIWKELPKLTGANTTIEVTAVRDEWIDAAEGVLEFFGSLGLKAGLHGRTLTFESLLSPDELTPQVGLSLIALDLETRRHLSPESLEEIRGAAVRRFDSGAESVLELLEEDAGEWRVRQVLGKVQMREERRKRDMSILSAIRKLGANVVVQFHCGTGGLLRKIVETSAAPCSAIGVEPSLIRVSRARARYATVFDMRHGSIIEPPAGLPREGLALLVDGLPPRTDTRFAVGSAAVCSIGFPWILAVQGDNADSRLEALADEAKQHSYRSGRWEIGGTDSAVLLRRSTASTKPAECAAIGDRVIATCKAGIRVHGEQWESTLEAFSLRTVDPKWLMYLPPSMACLQRDRPDGLLEHPEDAVLYYRNENVRRVVVETKHMGSRAIVVVCKSKEAARARFGTAETGCVYTRNGRPFFLDSSEFLGALQAALGRARFWDRFHTDWVCLDGEILPWSVKAQRLISQDHRETYEAGSAVMREIERASGQAGSVIPENISAQKLGLERYRGLLEKYEAEIDAPISFAPFHLIATEGRSYFDKDHHWHMRTLNALAKRGEHPFGETKYHVLDARQEAEWAKVFKWWDDLSVSGDEGVVVKPIHYICEGRRGQAQPAIKCRGREHLRLVYGPDYDEPEKRLRLLDRRALKRRRQKHRRILRQFTLSIEAVERFIRKEALGRVEECVRGVLSLETREEFSGEQSF